MARQALLLPEVVELDPAEAERVAGRAEELAALGLVIEPFGPGALLVREVPALLGETDAAGLIRDIADDLAENGQALALKERLEKLKHQRTLQRRARSRSEVLSVSIVGYTNAGKSTLFNRLIGERRAIVEDEPGTTRDRVYGTTDWGGVEFTLIDTGGLQDGREVQADSTAQIALETRNQAHVAIGEADVIVFMVDARGGLNAGDHEVAGLLRRADKPTILVANKADSAARRDTVYEFYELGLGDPIAISSYHGSGTGDLLDRIVEALPELTEDGLRFLEACFTAPPSVTTVRGSR